MRHYMLVMGTNNTTAGVIEKRHAVSNVLALVDFSTRKYWVSTSTNMQNRADGTVLLEQLKQKTGNDTFLLGHND
jgi:hypothetical protein